MIDSSAGVLRNKWRPREGWLPFILLLAIIILLISAVNEVQWAPEGTITGPSALLGFLLATYLAKRGTKWPVAWSLLLGYGLLFTTIWLVSLSSARGAQLAQESSTIESFRQNWAVFLDRIEGWLLAISHGGSSEETIVFALGLGLAAWLLAAYASWTVFRQCKPLRGLTALAAALAINAFFGNASLWPVPIFVGLAVMLIVIDQISDLERGWSRRKVDYPDDVRLDFIFMGAGIGLGLLTLSFIVPSVNVRAVSQFFQEQPMVRNVEDTLERLFAGVSQPRGTTAGEGIPGTGSGGRLPTTVLVGDPPELYETVVMTAAVASTPQGTVHWRGTSYDIYTGRGWSISPEREEIMPAGASIPIPEIEKGADIIQTVYWALGETSRRYTLGLPISFDQVVSSRWRGVDDLSRVTGAGSNYQAVSQVPGAAVDDLRQSSVERVPAVILDRYTQLPDSLPERVHRLAREVAGDRTLWPTRYDQAKAIEQFLRQYPYTLEVDLPRESDDVVDFFLFDLQMGYCDYYASSMVVMARSLGIPARLGSGYLPQPADENGSQIIYQINAHSWAELYFGEIGWVEFEPTAAFPASSPVELGPEESTIGESLGDLEADLPPIPLGQGRVLSYWAALAALIMILTLAGWFIVRHRYSYDQPDGIQRAFSKLQYTAVKLGQPAPVSQTPRELGSILTSYISSVSSQWYGSYINPPMISSEIERLTMAFEFRQYSGRKSPKEPALQAWRNIRNRLILLRLANWLKIERRR